MNPYRDPFANEPVSDETRAPISHDAVAAYLLDALPPIERIEFEKHLAGCLSCQMEVADLQPIARHLPSLLESPPEPGNGVQASDGMPVGPSTVNLPPQVPPVTEDMPPAMGRADSASESNPDPGEDSAAGATAANVEAPEDAPEADLPQPGPEHAAGVIDEAPVSPEMAEPAPPLAESAEPHVEVPAEAIEPATAPEGTDELPVEASAAPVPGEADTAEVKPAVEIAEPVAAVVEAPVRQSKPRGRVAPGVDPDPVPVTTRVRRTPWPWLVTSLAGVIAIGAVLAALALLDQIDNLEEEIDIQRDQIAALQADRAAYLAQTPAIAWDLQPTTSGAPDSTGVILADPAGAQAVLTVSGLPSLGEELAYQVWYLPMGGISQAGPVFNVDDRGAAVVLLAPNVDTFQAIAITEEPASGSTAPTSDPVMQGVLDTQ